MSVIEWPLVKVGLMARPEDKWETIRSRKTS